MRFESSTRDQLKHLKGEIFMLLKIAVCLLALAFWILSMLYCRLASRLTEVEAFRDGVCDACETASKIN